MDEDKQIIRNEWGIMRQYNGEVVSHPLHGPIGSREICQAAGICEEKLPEIDEMINTTARGWTTSRMGKVDLTIIRLAVYEIKFDEEVPDSVAINEAVELAKKFGQEESSGFVNGVLARFV